MALLGCVFFFRDHGHHGPPSWRGSSCWDCGNSPIGKLVGWDDLFVQVLGMYPKLACTEGHFILVNLFALLRSASQSGPQGVGLVGQRGYSLQQALVVLPRGPWELGDL